MPRFAVLLRGVNVGRGNRVPMEEFRGVLESRGYRDVRTLLNSGNAVFASDDRSATGHADRIRAALVERLAVDVPVIVKSAKDMVAIEAGNALATVATDPARLLVAFTREAKALEGLAALASLVSEPEQVHVGEHAAYLWCANGIIESKAAEALLGKLGRAATSRNWATFLKINALLRDHPV